MPNLTPFIENALRTRAFAECEKFPDPSHDRLRVVENARRLAQVVQDADRLDALGAIGVARCFSLAGQFRQDFYHESEPFPETRGLNDCANALDHFFAKLLNLEKKLQTASAREEGRKRTQFLSTYLQELKRELSAHLV